MIVFIDDIPHNYNSLEKNERYTDKILQITLTTNTNSMYGTVQATNIERQHKAIDTI